MYAPRAVRGLAIGAVAIFSLACGSDSITGAASVDGTYSLRTINGAALPVTLTDSLNGLPVQLTFMSTKGSRSCSGSDAFSPLRASLAFEYSPH